MHRQRLLALAKSDPNVTTELGPDATPHPVADWYAHNPSTVLSAVVRARRCSSTVYSPWSRCGHRIQDHLRLAALAPYGAPDQLHRAGARGTRGSTYSRQHRVIMGLLDTAGRAGVWPDAV